jgi:hypothetical protein
MQKRLSFESRAVEEDDVGLGTGHSLSDTSDSFAQGSHNLVVELVAPTHRDGVPYHGKYQVRFRGEILIEGSHDPEFDAARSLKARGFSGPVTYVDAITGKKRSTIPDIERAAGLCTKEGPLRFAKVSRPDRPPRPEAALPDSTLANGDNQRRGHP